MTRLLLVLFSLAFGCCLPCTLTAQPVSYDADAVFSGWSITCIAPHPSQPIVHLVDQYRYIHTFNLTDGTFIRRDYELSVVAGTIDYLTVDRRGNTYVVITDLFRSEHSVEALDEQLQPRLHFRLNEPSDMTMTLLDRPLLADTRGALYVVGQLLNGSHIVYSYDGSTGKHIDTWLDRQPLANLTYVVNIDAANFIYFQQTSLLTNGYRYTFLYSTGGVWSDSLVTNGSGCATVTSIAVSSTYNMALVCDRSDIRLFDTNGRRVESFRFESDGMTLTQLGIDYHDTLLVVTPSGGGAVVAVSADGAGATHLWRPQQSSFLDAAHMSYDPFTDSLLTWHSYTSGVSRPVQRVDTRSGVLLDVLTLPERLTAPVPPYGWSNCFVRSAPVGRRSGLLYRLLMCAAPTPQLRLYVTTAAGKLKRDMLLTEWANRFRATMPMAIDEVLDVALVALYGLTSRSVVLYAFSLTNGSALYNVSLGLTGMIVDLTSSHNHTALLTFSSRILVVNMADGTQLQRIDAPDGTQFTSAAYDGQEWYLGQSLTSGGGLINGSVVVWDAQQQQVQAVLVVGSGHHETWLTQPSELYSVLLADDGRVFALDRFWLAAYWQMRRHHSIATPASAVTASAAWTHRRFAGKWSATPL